MRASTRGSDSLEDRRRLDLAQQQLRRMEAVAEGEMCREQALLLAVGELGGPCGRCERGGESPTRRDWAAQVETLLAHLAEQDGTEMRRLGEHLALHEPGRHDRWTWLARRLVQEELIQESNDGAQRLYLRESGRRFLDSPWPLDYAA